MATLKLPTIVWTKPVYRGHDPQWSFAPTSGDGAKRLGGRFNPPGVSALYTSASQKTALLEAQQGFGYKFQPLTLCAYDVDCADIVDLTDAAVRKHAQITLPALSCAWENIASLGRTPPSWTVAADLTSRGISGIVVPSFATAATDSDVNVVFWKWADKPPHQVIVVDDDDRLPKDGSSWERVEVPD